MDDYDDSDEYSAANSFRARSNTWPLNRPDAPLANQVSIDEPLPEIQLEDDDLFTTNEHWSTGADLVDHDIMSWDPILNAQNISTNIHQTTTTRTTSQQLNNQNQPQIQSHQHHQHQLPLHHHLQQQQHPNVDIRHQQQAEIRHNTLLSGSTGMLTTTNTVMPPHQQQQQQHPQAPLHHQQTLNSNCFQNSDPTDDPNEYHIRQLHQLQLSNQPSSGHHYMSTSICIQQGDAMNAGCTPDVVDSYNLSSAEHHQLQPLSSAQYDLEAADLDNNEVCLNNTIENDQLHQLRPVLDRNQLNHRSQLLSSPMNPRDIGLSADLESDLEYKSVDPSAVLSRLPDDASTNKLDKQQPNSSSSSSKNNKLNTPRRNAWGNMSYADLISQAINSTNDKRLTLSQIYDWMVQHVPYFKDKGDSNSSAGWKNSVRHNLSLHNRFKRIQNEGTGKSSWWTINPEANVGKCARRRAASMEASKYEKKRRGAKKRADAIRSGLVSYPSLTNASLPNSFSLEQSMNQLARSSSGSNKNSLTFTDELENPTMIRTHSQPQQKQTIKYEIDQTQPQSHSPTSPPPPQPPPPPPPTQQQLQQQQLQVQQQLHQPQPQQPQQQTQELKPQIQHQQSQNQQQDHRASPNRQLHQPTLIQTISNQQQTHQIHTKLQTHETDSYFMQTHHIQQHPQQIMNRTDHTDLFGRHAIYMSEPCNDCNCTDQLINCGNALSLI